MSDSSAYDFNLTRRSGRRFFFVAGAFCCLLLAACATTPPGASPVESRAQARWDAVISGDYPSAYALYSPGFRSSTSAVDFEISMRMRRVNWISAQVQSAECTASACTVEVKVGYRVAAPVPGMTRWENSQVVHERWVMTEGQWWFLPEA